MTKKYPESETSQEPATAWVLTDGKAGDETQCLAVAEAPDDGSQRRLDGRHNGEAACRPLTSREEGR